MLIDSERTKRLLKAYGFHAPKMTVDKLLDDETFAVDAVEVVRCEDCRYRHEVHPWQTALQGDEAPDYVCGVTRTGVNRDDFCSYGERRADADN